MGIAGALSAIQSDRKALSSLLCSLCLLQVPLRRVNQAYTIATSTKVDVSSADLSSLTDAQFVPKKAAKKKGGDKFFEQPEGKKVGCGGCMVQRSTQCGPYAMRSMLLKRRPVGGLYGGLKFCGRRCSSFLMTRPAFPAQACAHMGTQISPALKPL